MEEKEDDDPFYFAHSVCKEVHWAAEATRA